nr:MAG TPA: hypothetical protein [Caudoviricetes sp.]
MFQLEKSRWTVVFPKEAFVNGMTFLHLPKRLKKWLITWIQQLMKFLKMIKRKGGNIGGSVNDHKL